MRLTYSWTREEILLAFNLYFKIPYRTITGSNPHVKKLAELIGRTPNAVGLKLCNFARFDPYHQARGIKGLTNGGKLEEIIFKEFTENWEEMLFESERLLAEKEKQTIEEVYAPILNNIISEKHGEYKIREVKTRVNQDLFRKIILSIYGNRCAISGLDIPDLLIASHILDWATNEKERLNPENGICLSNLYDRAFEKGYIGIDFDYNIIISPQLKKKSQNEYFENLFGKYEKKKIILPDRFLPNKSFLKFHLNEIFKS